jgi:hypothetical protein
MVPKK